MCFCTILHGIVWLSSTRITIYLYCNASYCNNSLLIKMMLGKICSSWFHPLGMCWMQWCIHKHTILVFGAYSSWDWAAVQSQQQISCKKCCLLVILSVLQVLELDFWVPLGFCDMLVLSWLLGTHDIYFETKLMTVDYDIFLVHW